MNLYRVRIGSLLDPESTKEYFVKAVNSREAVRYLVDKYTVGAIGIGIIRCEAVCDIDKVIEVNP